MFSIFPRNCEKLTNNNEKVKVLKKNYKFIDIDLIDFGYDVKFGTFSCQIH